MTLQHFYQDFGHGFPLSVVKEAYGYVQSGNPIVSVFKTASILYAAKLENQPLRHSGYTCERRISKVTVYHLQTVSLSGLKRILPYASKENRGLSIARLGENSSCDEVASFESSLGSVLGNYSYRNRYASVVRLSYGDSQLDENMQESLKRSATVLAKNALAWWPSYQDALEKVEHCKKHNRPFDAVPEWKEFLLKQELCFAEPINDGYETGSRLFARVWVTIGDYLQTLKEQTGLTLIIEDINLYGF